MKKIRIKPVVDGLIKPHRGVVLGLSGGRYRAFCHGETIEVDDDCTAINFSYVEVVGDDIPDEMPVEKPKEGE